MIIKDYMSRSGHVTLAFLLTMILLSFGTLPAMAGNDCEEICSSPAINEIHTKPVDMPDSLCSPPQAHFCACPWSGCDTLTVKFTDYSLGYIDTWEWDFGDGGTSNEESPSHFYDTPGYYTVTLTVTGPGGTSTKTKTNDISVRTSPTADFSFVIRPGCLPATVDFTDLSDYAIYWHWDFGDGSESLEQNPTHIYTAAGTYIVKLKVMNFCGLDYKIREVIITADTEPIADFTSDKTETCEGAVISFTDLSQYADTWEWDFGDGTTSPDQNPTHTYTVAGVYPVTLTVTNDCGRDTETKLEYITVHPGPIADFDYSAGEGCSDGSVYFTDLSINADSWMWNFGDGNTSADQNPTHTYSQSGTYVVSLTVTNDCGSDTEQRGVEVLIGQPPVADFEADYTRRCIDQPIRFTDLSTGAESWDWDFGDGYGSSDQNPSHTYTSTGTYTVSLTVTNECGRDTEEKIEYIVIYGEPNADFTYEVDEDCSDGTAIFTDLSTGATTWFWDFGDGDSSTDQNPTHVYTQSGTYEVILRVTNECGSDYEDHYVEIQIGEPPVAEFDVTNPRACVMGYVHFHGTPYNVDSWLWNFGDGNTSTERSPAHQYDAPGWYTVSLTVRNSCGSDTKTRENLIEIIEDPVADFHASETVICAGTEIEFFDNSQNAEEWHWDFGDGSTSDNGPNVTHTYTQDGTFTVSLTVRNVCGDDTRTREQYITVKYGPISSFTVDNRNICINQTVQFGDRSTRAEEWLWNFGDGNTSTEQNPSHTYTAVGDYDVSLRVTNDCGSDYEFRTAYISVGQAPVADFRVSDTIVCAYNDVQFTDLSTDADSWEWNFGDGQTSTAQNPTHSYSGFGFYNVTLTVKNNCGDDTEVKNEYIYVRHAPIAGFRYEADGICYPVTVNFFDESASATSWHWDFGDGNTSTEQNPTYTYTGAGDFSVTLTATNECGDDEEFKEDIIHVQGGPWALFEAEETWACANTDIQFYNNSQYTDSVLWDFGDGTTSTDWSPSHSYSTEGYYTVSLTGYNECGKDTETKTEYISISPLPTADFSYEPDEGCEPLTVNFTNLSTHIDGQSWDFGDGNHSSEYSPTHTYDNPGTYTVTLHAGNMCGDDHETKEDIITVLPKPIADFRVSDRHVCVGDTISFTDESQHATSWTWDFGDGTTSHEQHPKHAYTHWGDYTVILTATNDCGSDEEERWYYITVDPLPTAEFEADLRSGCGGVNVTFTNYSTYGSSYHWDFGDGSTSSDYAPSHYYGTPGVYTVSLTASNPCGDDTETKIEYITVHPMPHADFDSDVQTVCVNEPVTFIDQSTDADDWYWDFGDGEYSPDQNPVHTYSSPGQYDVELTVSNMCGDDSEYKTEFITVIAPPIADFGAEIYEGCVGETIYFYNMSQNAKSVTWDFGDGTTSGQYDGMHVYTVAGIYTIKLTVENECDKDFMEKVEYITIHPKPVADFTSDKTQVCTGATVTFTDESLHADEWLWHFGDGTTSPDQNPTHTYTVAGTYMVKLTATNDCGDDTEVKEEYITVSPPPIADFTVEVNNVCTMEDVYFMDRSTNATEWHWDFGDGGTSSGLNPNPQHTYTQPGIYTVTLRVTNACGEDTEIKEAYITVGEGPIADFESDKTEACVNTSIAFTDLSTGAQSWSWDFGDGATSPAQNPTHTYTVPGTYTVELTVRNDCGPDTETKVEYITIYEDPIADFDVEIRDVCFGDEVYFTDLSQYATSWSWDFGDGTTSNVRHPSHFYNTAGTYTVTLTVYNDCGDDTETKEAYITVSPVPIADFNSEVTEICKGETMYFFNTSQYADSYLWDFGDGTTSQAIDPTHVYNVAGVYTVSLTAYNICGDDTETKVNYVTIIDGPTADFSATPTSGSSPLDVAFTDLSTSHLTINTWSWTFGDGGTSSAQSPSHTYTAPGTYTVSLTVTDECGSDTETKIEYINVVDTCAVDFFAEPTGGCVETIVYFNGTATGDCNIVSWLWNFGDPASGGLNTATGQIVEHRYRLDGTYTVTMTAVNDEDSIVVTKTNFITIYGGPNAAFDANPTSGSAPLLVNFTDMSTSGLSIYSWEWNFGDPTSSDNTSILQDPSHIYTSDGTYDVSLIVENECGVDTAFGEITVTPSISVTKFVDKPFARMGEDLVYSVTIRNNTQEPIGNILVTDTIPDSTGYITGSISGNGIYDSNSDLVSWFIPLVNPGAEETVSFMVNLDGPFTTFPTMVYNQAIAYMGIDVKSASTKTYYSNIVETEVDQTTGGELGIVKAVSATLASRGDVLTYTISVVNDGRDIANNVTVYDAIPDSTTYVTGSISSGGNYSSSTDSLVWSLGTLNPFESRVVSFQVTVDLDIDDNVKIPNTALVKSSLGDDQSNEVITAVSIVPIVVTKTTSTPSGMIGDLMRFTIQVQNFTDQLFTDVQLTDTMPNGIFYIDGTSLLNGSAVGDPTDNNPTYIWSLGDLPASGTLTLQYTSLVGASAQPGMHENVARAMAMQAGVPTSSNRAIARVYILGSTLSGSIRGRVIVDCDGDGVADLDSVPSPIDIYLDDGSQSQSNEQGMFYFSTVRPGERVVMLDERDLDGYYVPEGAQTSVFAHVHETGESYILFRICPEYARLNIEKKASIVPTIKLTKKANLNPEQITDSLGVLIDYEIDIKSNGLADPTRVRVVDSFPESMNLILDESQELKPTESGNELTYEVTAAQERMQKSVLYSLRDLEPGMRQFLTNKVFLEGDIEKAGQAVETVTSEPVDVAVGPFLLAPPKDVLITLTPALFITSMADLQEPAFPQLEAAADSIMKYADADIEVGGHCDYRKINTPEFPSNWELGEARAKSVVDWLVVNRNVDRDRLSYESFAATRPIVEDVHTSELLQPNRRTEVIIKTRIGGFMDPSAIPAGGWEKTTSMTLNPVTFDTVFEASNAVLEAGLDDTWEVIVTIENTSMIAAENTTLTDVIPDGAVYVENSATLDGNDVVVTVEGQNLLISIDKIDPSQTLELRYRIRAIEGTNPSGGGAASIEVKTSNDQPVIQSSNEVRFK